MWHFQSVAQVSPHWDSGVVSQQRQGNALQMPTADKNAGSEDPSPPPGDTTNDESPPPLPLTHLKPSDEDRIAVHLKRVPFCFVWWFALLCHCGCAAFLCSTTALYVFLGGINMIYYNKLLGSTLRNQMSTLGYVFVAIAALHFLEILRMLWFSLRARKLTFNPIHKPKHAVVPSVPVSAQNGKTIEIKKRRLRRPHLILPPVLRRVLPTGLSRPLRRVLHALRPHPRVVLFSKRVARFLKRCKTKLFDRKHGLLGLESPYFNLLFLLRETMEIASQSYQMYKCSRLISSAWINNLFLAITVLNCWSTPILQHALARFNALERVVCLSLDSALDAGTCMLIPVIIVLKYVDAFDRTLLEFPIENLTDPIWFTGLILENRMLFAMNKTDLFTGLMPHYSLFGCLRKVKRLIERLPPEYEDITLEVTYVNSMRVLVPRKKPNAEAKPHANAPQLIEGIKQQEGEMPGWKRRFVHLFFIGWGATVLGVHTRARQVSNEYSDVVACKKPLRPWFASSFMCASYQFDCVEQGNVATLTDADLSVMDASTLSSLVISNCPAFEMPDAIGNFSGLLKFMLYNSTVVSWPSSASLNAVSHSSLISICVVACNMSSFPLGLQEQQPDSLQDVQFALTNLTSLPDELSRGWRVSKIFFEYCDFTEFPVVLSNLRVTELSLAGSKFMKLPSNLSSMSTSYEEFVLSGSTNLTTIYSGSLPSGLKTLSIEQTNVTTLSSSDSSTTTVSSSGGGGSRGGGGGTPPVAMATGPSTALTVYANNTPMCEAMGGVSDADLGTTNSSSSSSTTVYCSTRDPNGVARFPLAWTIERFAPS